MALVRGLVFPWGVAWGVVWVYVTCGGSSQYTNITSARLVIVSIHDNAWSDKPKD